MSDRETFGLFPDAIFVRDLRLCADSIDAGRVHCRNCEARESGVVIELTDQKWVAAEIRLGDAQIDKAGDALQMTIACLVRDGAHAPPAALFAVCGTGQAAFQQPDGVCVVPITARRDF